MFGISGKHWQVHRITFSEPDLALFFVNKKLCEIQKPCDMFLCHSCSSLKYTVKGFSWPPLYAFPGQRHYTSFIVLFSLMDFTTVKTGASALSMIWQQFLPHVQDDTTAKSCTEKWVTCKAGFFQHVSHCYKHNMQKCTAILKFAGTFQLRNKCKSLLNWNRSKFWMFSINLIRS